MDAQRLASDPLASAWVSASAGTGKTHVLTNRVLRLMLAEESPQAILCLTFTRAAAAEMANRIHDRLARWSRLSDDDLAEDIAALTGGPFDARIMARARRLFATVLDLPGGLKIQTIHSFCQSLLGRFPLEAGIAPHFQAIDERTAAEFLRDATASVLAAARTAADDGAREAIAVIANHASETDFLELLKALLSERGKLDRLFGILGEADAAAMLKKHLGLSPSDGEESVVAAACREDAFDRDGLADALAGLAAGSATDRARGNAIGAWLSSPATRVGNLDEYRNLYLTGSGEIRKRLITKTASEQAPGAAVALSVEAERVRDVEQRRLLARTAAVSVALLTLADKINTAYETVKTAHAVLDYDDLIIRASILLSESGAAGWVLYKLDGGIDHILIDEAQDTNPEQWQVVKALADEFFAGAGGREAHRTIFAVGDAKQSIFSFQRADPAEFENWRKFFVERVREARFDFHDVELNLSFRSTPAVLALVDRVFASPDAAAGLMFSGRPIEHEANRGGEAGLVELWPVVVPEGSDNDDAAWTPPLTQRAGDDPEARLARRVADRIQEWLDNGEVLAARGRAITPGDIMVLVRRRTPFVAHLVAALKAGGVAVAGADRMRLTDQIAVMDLIALGRFLLLPDDDLTLGVVLKGPLFCFDDAALFDLAHRRPATLWQALRHKREQSASHAEAFAMLSRLLAESRRLPAYEFYAHLLTSWGGRRKMTLRLGMEAGEPIDEFLAFALEYQRLHAPSLEGFLNWIEGGDTDIKRDMDQGRDEVRVMTVHGAKGLQAPVVILPDTCQVPRHGPRLLWFEDGPVPAPVWAPKKAYEVGAVADLRAGHDEARMREYRRLLYVALTRAEDRLYVTGWETSKGRAEGCWYDMVKRAMTAWPEVETIDGAHGAELRHASGRAKPHAADATGAGPRLAPADLPGWALTPAAAEPRPGPVLNPSRLGGDEPALASPLSSFGNSKFQRGNLMHRLLQSLPDLPPQEREEAARRLLGRRQYGLRAEDIETIARDVLAVIAEPSFAAVFGAASRAEVPIVGVVGDVAISGQIDRLATTEDEVLVVDFKTNRTVPQSEDGVAEIYLRQMAAYRQLLRQVYPGKTVRCALLWTDSPELMPLSDAALDRAWLEQPFRART